MNTTLPILPTTEIYSIYSIQYTRSSCRGHADCSRTCVDYHCYCCGGCISPKVRHFHKLLFEVYKFRKDFHSVLKFECSFQWAPTIIITNHTKNQLYYMPEHRRHPIVVLANWLYISCIASCISYCTLLILLHCAAVDIRPRQSLSSQMWQKIMKRGRRHHLSSPVCSASRLIGKQWMKNTLRCKQTMAVKVGHRCWFLA